MVCGFVFQQMERLIMELPTQDHPLRALAIVVGGLFMLGSSLVLAVAQVSSPVVTGYGIDSASAPAERIAQR